MVAFVSACKAEGELVAPFKLGSLDLEVEQSGAQASCSAASLICVDHLPRVPFTSSWPGLQLGFKTDSRQKSGFMEASCVNAFISLFQ